ncbi:MAG TPA: RNA polymerase sigma factor [Candidatus Binatia bacterium]|nr:RNA polymerase sigma factor [Candidatus Binatia bacterium]
MADIDLPDTLREDLRTAWHRYVDLLAPLRPVLHGYCRRLTGNVWDAEDLVQDTLLRAFGTLGSIHVRVENPRAYLLRTATHLWIDTVRRRGSEASALAEQPREVGVDAEPGAARDVGTVLLQRLAPQERAAVVLKELFDWPLEEIAGVLATSVGAVKAALHRGRTRLREPEDAAPARRPVPSVALVDRFVNAYNAADLPALLGLMLDTGSVENVGSSVDVGRAAFARRRGWFEKAVGGHPEWPPQFAYEAARLERVLLDGEPVALGFCTRRGREALEQVLRLEELDGLIARIRGYAFCSETMREVGTTLGLRVRTGLYRFPTPEPGKLWPEQDEKGERR